MLNKKIKIIIIAASLLLTTLSFGHTETLDNKKIEEDSLSQKIDNKIIELADNLLTSAKISQADMGNIAITSFVNLHNLETTSSFGRALGETFFHELFVRGFNVTDFRGQNSLNINKTGEFYITRDIKRINKKILNRYVLVGTYAPMGDEILLNTRILDNVTGEVVAVAKSYFESSDCKIFMTCKKPRMLRIVSK